MVKAAEVLIFGSLLIGGIVSSAVAEVHLKHLHVKFAPWDGFYKLPVSVNQIKNKESKFVKMDHDKELNVDLYSYHQDPSFSILFDTHGHIAGLRIAMVKGDLEKRGQSKGLAFPYDYDKNPMCSSGKYWNTDVWYSSVLFTSPENLIAGGRSDTKGLVAEDIYLKLEGKWTKISKYEKDAVSQQFTRQGCYIGMGQHYFYKMTPEASCKDLQGVFLLFERGKLNGMGLHMLGSFTPRPVRDWLEDAPLSVVKKIAKHAPPCVHDWVDKYGLTALHIYFNRFPRFTFCIWPFQ